MTTISKAISLSGLLILGLILPATSFCQVDKIYELNDTVVVTATRTVSSVANLNRSVTVISRNDIESSPASSINELLSQTLSIDLRQRGAKGVQADISIRGGGFEQTLILIDGIKVNDPQTGHHNLNIGLELNDIERIELLRGPGGRVYGPNGMNGVINIITKFGQKSDSGQLKNIHFESAVGDFGLFERAVSLSGSLNQLNNRISLCQKSSSGYQSNSEFDIKSISYSAQIGSRSTLIRLKSMYSEKEFGAYKFYSDNFPDEWEATKTALVSVSADYFRNKFEMSPKLYWRHHEDDFILDRNRPEWYRNQHSTNKYGAELTNRLETGLGTIVLVLELSGDEIKSKSLGNHYRTNGGIIAEQHFSLNEFLSITPGITAYYHSDWGWGLWPGIDLGYAISDNFRLFLSAGKTYRVPTFTDLFYQSPANMGNPNLKPEETWTYELGSRYKYNSLVLQAAVFVRDGKRLIDWVRSDAQSKWEVRNVADVNTVGTELSFTYNPMAKNKSFGFSMININYAYLKSDRTTSNLESKYLLDYLRHNLTGNIEFRCFSNLSQRWALKYHKKIDGNDYFVADTKIMFRLNKLELFAEISNLFNIDYVEIGTIPMPGRWFRAGVKYDLIN